MATHYRTEGYVLKKTDLREADQLFTVYTRDYGKVDILGRAIRKMTSKLRSGIELFYLSEIEFIQGKAYKTLTDAILINKFKNIRNDLEKMKTAYQIVDMVDGLIKGQEPDERIWKLLNESFERLSLSTYLIYHYFFWNFLSVLGYQIDLYNCVYCKKQLIPLKLYFNAQEGGIFCAKCFNESEDRIDVSPETIKIVRLLSERDWNVLERFKIDEKHKEELQRLSDYYLEFLNSTL